MTVVRRGDVAMPVDVLLRFEGGRELPLALGRRGALEALPRRVAGRACSKRSSTRTRRSCSTPTARTTAGAREGDPRAATRWTARAVFWVQNLIDFVTVAW